MKKEEIADYVREKVKAIPKNELPKKYEQIVRYVQRLTPPRNSEERTALEVLIKEYIRYQASAFGVQCDFAFRAAPVDAEKICWGTAYVDQNLVVYNNAILEPQTVGDFAFFTAVIAHELQHLRTEKLLDYYNSLTPDGLNLEYAMHSAAFKKILKFFNEDALKVGYTLPDKTLFETVSRAIYFLDDHEKLSREAGIKAQQDFLTAVDRTANKGLSQDLIDLQKVTDALVLDENEDGARQKYLLQEVAQDSQNLLDRLVDTAVQIGDKELLDAVCEMQDVKPLANKKTFDKLQKVTQVAFPSSFLRLANSKYYSANSSDTSSALTYFFENEGNLAEAKKLLFNLSNDEVEKKISPVLLEQEKLKQDKKLPAPKDVPNSTNKNHDDLEK